MKKSIVFFISIYFILPFYNIGHELKENEVAKFSEINLYFTSQYPQFTQAMNMKTRVIDEQRSGSIEMEIYNIICKNKRVKALKYIRVNGKDFLERKREYPFIEYLKMWKKLYKLGALTLKNIPTFEEIKSPKEFEKIYKGIGDLSTYKYKFVVGSIENTYKIYNVSQMVDNRYWDIQQIIREFLDLSENEAK